jgi:hypothetical protein
LPLQSLWVGVWCRVLVQGLVLGFNSS